MKDARDRLQQQIARSGRGGGGLVYSPTLGAPQRRVLVVSERGGIPPLARHTSHRPDAHAVSLHGEMSQPREPGGDCERGPRRRDNSGRLPFPDPRDSVPTFPPLTASTRRELPACEPRDARR